MALDDWTPLLAAHVGAAVVALVLGAFNLRRRPRGDRLHKAVGYTWVGLMYWVAASSFWIRELNDGRFSPIHLLSVLTIVTLTLGVYFAIRRNRRAHRANMIGTYLGLVGALIGALAAPQRAIPQLATSHTLLFAGLLVGLVAAGILCILGLRAWTKARRPVATPSEQEASP